MIKSKNGKVTINGRGSVIIADLCCLFEMIHDCASIEGIEGCDKEMQECIDAIKKAIECTIKVRDTNIKEISNASH